MLREPGREDGEVYDPKYKDTRTWIELHKCRFSNGTAGCICVLGDWGDFMSNLRTVLSSGVGEFSLEENPDATNESIEFTNIRSILKYTKSHKGKKKNRKKCRKCRK